MPVSTISDRASSLRLRTNSTTDQAIGGAEEAIRAWASPSEALARLNTSTGSTTLTASSRPVLAALRSGEALATDRDGAAVDMALVLLAGRSMHRA